jgi:hypothetical protein
MYEYVLFETQLLDSVKNASGGSYTLPHFPNILCVVRVHLQQDTAILTLKELCIPSPELAWPPSMKLVYIIQFLALLTSTLRMEAEYSYETLVSMFLVC